MDENQIKNDIQLIEKSEIKGDNNEHTFESVNKLYLTIIKNLNVGDRYNEFIKFMILKVIANDFSGNNDVQSMVIIPSPQIQLLWKELYLKSKMYKQLCNLLGGEGVVNSIQYDQDELDKLNKYYNDGDENDEIANNNDGKHEEFRSKYLNTRSLYKQYFVIDSNEFDEILESNELNRHWPITFLMNNQEKDKLKEIIKKKRNDKIMNNNNNGKVNNKRKEREDEIVDDQPPSPISKKIEIGGNLLIRFCNETFSILVHGDEYIQDIKQRIEERKGISSCKMFLTCNGSYLDDCRTLKCYNIKKNYSTIYMGIKLCGC